MDVPFFNNLSSEFILKENDFSTINFFFLTFVVLGNKLLFSNPCLASLSNKNGIFQEKRILPSTTTPSFVKNLSMGSTLSAIEAASCKSADDHTKLWTIERALSLALVPLVPAAFFFPSAPMDYLLAFSFTLHAHW